MNYIFSDGCILFKFRVFNVKISDGDLFGIFKVKFSDYCIIYIFRIFKG